MEKQNLIIGGILVTLLLIGGGVYLSATGNKLACKSGWVEQPDGQYGCMTSTGTRLAWCVSVQSTANTLNYWCMEGKLISPSTTLSDDGIKQYLCDNVKCVEIG